MVRPHLHHVSQYMQVGQKAGPAPRAPRRPPPPAPPFRAQRTGHPRAGHAARIFGNMLCRHGRGGTCRRYCRNPCCADPRCGSSTESACRWCGPRKPPTEFPPRRVRAAALCGRFCPGLRLSSHCWIMASSSATPGGQPSTVAPKAGPWLSPHVVTRNKWPNVLKLIEFYRFFTVNGTTLLWE